MPNKKKMGFGSRLGDALRNAAKECVPLYDNSGDDSVSDVLGHSPNIGRVSASLEIFIEMVLPSRSQGDTGTSADLSNFFIERGKQAIDILRPEMERAIPYRWKGRAAQHEHVAPETQDVAEIVTALLDEFLGRFSDIRRMLLEDIEAAYNGDPAALTCAEVKLAYPGMLAISTHRLAHELYDLDVPIIPRIMSEWAHGLTGIDIHPGAKIGHGFFIDHGTGVVIGETSSIGNHVKLYQGVTLGAKSFPLDKDGNPTKHIKRHPSVEDNVIIYANSTILGGKTQIGKNSTVGGNVFLMESVPKNSFIQRRSKGLIVRKKDDSAGPLKRFLGKFFR